MRKCPADATRSIGDYCPFSTCVAWDQAAKHNCCALHVGRLDITVHDLAHIKRESARWVTKQVAKGQARIMAFVELMREVDDLMGSTGCFVCGSPHKDHTDAECSSIVERRTKYAAVVAIDKAMGGVPPAVWYRLMARPDSKLLTCYQLFQER